MRFRAIAAGATIGIVAPGDPREVRTWSGVPFFIVRALEAAGYRAVWLPAENRSVTGGLRKLNDWVHERSGRRFLPKYFALRNALAAQSIRAGIARHKVDAVLSITSDQCLRYLRTDVPVIHTSDTTFAGMVDYYPDFTDLLPFAERAGHDICRRAIRTATLTVYPSDWARDLAVSLYGADPNRVRVIPYGANLFEPPSTDCVAARQAAWREGHVRLLFVGGDWDRKGGPIAAAAAERLVAEGIDCRLDVIGAGPAEPIEAPWFTCHGFLNKSRPDHRALYDRLWAEASLFLLPSRGETFGAVYCEAAANALPAIAADTGGVSSAVIDGRTGLVLPLDADGAAFATAIRSLMQDEARYGRLVSGARERFDQCLTWDHWVASVIEGLNEVLSRGGEKTRRRK
ncbi:MAG: glycosyltransferase family 4 protein [Alphaproteobacteria bacterium]|nr:glycosyltransferase family 4 protein [Alphaproteobacteria bacterium]